MPAHVVRRIAKYGSGVNPFGALSDEDLRSLADGMREAGRNMSELELVGGIRGRFEDPTSIANVDEALADLPRQIEQGFTTICFKPAMFCRSSDEVPALCRYLVSEGRRLSH